MKIYYVMLCLCLLTSLSLANKAVSDAFEKRQSDSDEQALSAEERARPALRFRHPKLASVDLRSTSPKSSNIVIAMYHFFEDAEQSERGERELEAERALVTEAARSWQHYAARHGYAFVFVDANARLPDYMRARGVHPTWYRYKLFEEILNESEERVDFVVLVESDVVCTVPRAERYRADTLIDSIDALVDVYEAREANMVDPGLRALVKSPDVFAARTFHVAPSAERDDVPLHGHEHVRYAYDLGVIVARNAEHVRRAFLSMFAAAIGGVDAESLPLEPSDLGRQFLLSVDANRNVEVRALGHTFVADQRHWEPGTFALQVRTALKAADVERRIAAYVDSVAVARHLAADRPPHNAPAMRDRLDITDAYTDDWRVKNYAGMFIQ
jgi:hypothetical protein